MKKILSFVLALALIIATVPFGAFAVTVSAETTTSGTTGDCTWTLVDGVLTISGNGAMGDYSFVGNGPTAVGNAPWGADITEVIIEDGVTNVGEYAFFRYDCLTNITIGDDVTSIGVWAFGSCTGITSVTLPTNIISIGDCAFNGCTGLTDVAIPDSVASIGEAVFSGCTGLIDIVIPNGVTKIGHDTFYNCTSLTGITIPDSVTSISNKAFTNCANLTIYGSEGSYAQTHANRNGIPFAVLGGRGTTGDCTWTLVDGVLTISGNGAMADYTSTNKAPWYDKEITQVVIEFGVTKIGDYAFCHSNIEKITIPHTVENIGDFAFYCCDKLKTVNFQHIDTLAEIQKIGCAAFYGCHSLENMVIPRGITEIRESTFYDCLNLKTIFIPKSVTCIESNAFTNCALEKIYYCGNEQEKENIVISQENNDISLAEWSYIDAAGTVGECTWYLDGDVLTIIGEGNMGEYSAAESGVIGVDFPTWSIYGSQIKDIVIENGVENIARGAFAWQYYNIRSVSIPQSVTSIGNGAFITWGSDNFTEIIIPDTVTSIGNLAFSGCENLTIYGSEGSCAQRYANENNIPFVAVVMSVPGDANGDGRVNSRDVVLITQYNNGWPVTINLDNADVNDDGRANSRDVVLIVQYNNGWPVELK